MKKVQSPSSSILRLIKAASRFLIPLLTLLISSISFAQVSDTEAKQALQLVSSSKASLGLSADDLNQVLVTTTYFDKSTGLTMVYLQQTYAGIPVLKQIMPLAFKGNKLVSKAGAFEHSMDQIVNVKSGIPAISAASAVQYAIADRKLTSSKLPVVIGTKENGRKIEYNDMGVSGQNITAELLWVPVEESIKKENTVSTKISMRLSWQVFIAPTTSSDYWMVCIDAIDNKTIRVDNLTIYDHWGHPNESKTGGSSTINNSKVQTINSATDLFGTKNLLKLNEQIPNSPSLVNNSTYLVIPFPAESPLISPPAVVSNPWTAAPGNATTLGWHTGAGGINYDYTKGNNAWAYADRDGINGGSLAETVFSTTTPDPLTFNFVPDFSVDPLQSTPVPNKQFNVTNLFYWTNVIHDVMYQYGFDEPAHNFQDDNLGRGGIGNDYVFAEAQDGSGTNNANFSTPNDGTSGRMQMYLWNLNGVSPNRDGDVDNGIVVHEYGHGISIRLTGGGANVCLSGAEQMGEGWSDYYGLMFTTNWATATASDGFNIPRHIGTYAINNVSIFTCPYSAPVPPCTAAPNLGIRHFPYSTNMAVNPWVYATVIPSAVHDRGELWADTLWDMTWNIIAQEGINANLYNVAGGGGNNIALQLVTLGLKLQPCSVGFISGRDAILAADQALYAGAHRCAIMNAFARRGMGLNASQGLSSSVTDQVPDFTGYQPEVLLTQNGTVSVFEGQNIVYNNRVTNSNCEAISNYTLRDTLPLNVTFVSATNGGTYNAGTRVVSWPVNLAVSAVADYGFTVNINLGSYFPPAPPLIAAVNMRSGIFNNVDSRLSFSDTITIIGSVNTVINAAPPVVITAENAVPANNAPDPGETLTVNLPLINIGATNTTNLVATLLATGGVSAPSGPQTYGVVVSLAPSIAMPYTFTASGNCGDNIILTLALQDGATNLGTITYSLPLGVEQGSTQTFANTTAIIIPATGTGAATGSPANPYPSNINVSGMVGTITKVKVGLKQFNHTYPGDIDVLLVSPTGQKMMLMSDAANGFFIATNVNINLDDAATILLPSGTAIPSGTYRPTNYTAGDAFPAPAPAGPYLSPATIGSTTLASAFGGQNPNGTWSLYVVDDVPGDVGNFNGGWDITITTTFNVCSAVPPPTVINPVITTGTVGAAFSQTFTASGGTAPYTFTTASTLPTGLSFSAAGELSGIPTQVGTFPIVVTVTDNNASTGTGSTYTLVISCITNPIVINNNNSGPGSLRQAVIDACPGSTITFDMNTVTSPISLSGGLIRIDKNLTIQGPGTNPLTVQNSAPKNYSSRVFHVVQGVTANISGFTISGANTYGSGGGIYNEGVLNIMNATISNNLADSAGAGIYNLGSLTVTNSTISNNLSNSLGYTGFGAYGGGICSFGYYGGGTVNVTNSTISNNSANFGGGIYSNGTINFRNSIIAGNTSRYASSPDLNVYGTLTSQGYNLVGKTDGSSGWVATDLTGTIATPLNPLLGPLADNGGPTQTLALLAGSPAIDKGSAVAGITIDQRGDARPFDIPSIPNAAAGNGSDIGAFESQTVFPVLNINDVTQIELNSGTSLFTFTVSLSAPAEAGGVTFDIATQNNSATTADNDYVLKSLTSQTIPAGSSTYTFDVTVNGDVTVEPDETFFVNITNVTGATVSDGQGLGTITNDDCASGSQTFNYTGGVQDYVIPAGINSITLGVTGADGGDKNPGVAPFGGSGGVINASFAVQPGDHIRVIVGQAGQSIAAGGGGGGTGVINCGNPADCANGVVLLVAGGGGGGNGTGDLSLQAPGGGATNIAGNGNGSGSSYGGGGFNSACLLTFGGAQASKTQISVGQSGGGNGFAAGGGFQVLGPDFGTGGGGGYSGGDGGSLFIFPSTGGSNYVNASALPGFSNVAGINGGSGGDNTNGVVTLSYSCNVCPTIAALSATTSPVCQNTNTTLNATGLTGMGTTYGIEFKYFAAPTATPYTGGTTIATITNGSLNAAGTTASTTTSFATAGTYYIYAILSPVPVDVACRPLATTTLLVNLTPATPTITGGPTTFCTGGSVTLTSSSGTGNQWYLNGNPIGGAVNQTYVATASGNYTVIVTALGCPSAPSVATTVTVNPTPPTPTNSGGTTTFCTGGSVTLTSSSATGNQWYLNGNPIGGATNQTYVATASGNYTVIVTALGCPSAPSVATTVTINPTPPTPTITGGPTTFCTGGSVTLTSSSGTGNQWYLNGNPIGGAVNQTYVATASGNYTVIVTALDCPSAPSVATTVTVNPTPPTPTISGGPTTFCTGGSVTLTSSSATGNQWYLNGNPIGGATNQTYVATASGNYTVIVTALGCPSAPSVAITVTVNPTPNAVATPSSQTICSGSAVTTIALTGNVSGTVYNLTRDNTVAVTGIAAGGAGNISGSLTNTTNAPVTVTFTITPTANSCPGIPITATVLVNPTPNAVATPSSQAVCSKVNITTIVLSGNVAGTIFDWTRDNLAVTGIASSGSGDISGALTNNSMVPLTVTFTITPKANGCYGTPVTATVTVNPITVISVNPVSQTIFALNNTSFSVTATGTAPVTYQWQVSTNAGATYSNLADGGVYSGTGTNTLSLTAVPYTMSGYKYQCVVTGGCTTATSTAATLTINRRPTVITYTGDNTEQYSDQQTLTATLKDQLTNTPLSGKTVTFTIGIQSVSDGPAAPGNGTDATGIASAQLKLYQNPGSYTVASAFAGDATYLPASDSDPFTITKENAISDYTGPEFINVPCATCATTTILLSASIRDTTAVYPLNDIYPGDIRKARVKFINLNTLADISGWLTPGLVNVADTTKGIVSYSWVVPIPSTGYDVYSIAVIVDGPSATVGNYIGKTETVVNVSRNTLTEFITGGGNIVPSASNGQYASDAGKKVNFGFNVKYNRNGTNLQGNMNIIFRRGTRVYQIKATSMTSLSINSANPCSKKAIFTSKANLTDVTNPAAAASIYGGITLKVTMTDNGEPGNTDMIGITLLNGSNLVYSSNWVSTQTNELVLNGGNLIVHNGVVCPNPFVSNTNQPDQRGQVPAAAMTDEFSVTVYPNPSSTDFAIQVNSQSSEPILINVMDVSGRILESFKAITKGKAIKVGSNLRSGTYFAEVTQGVNKQVVKLIKLN